MRIEQHETDLLIVGSGFVGLWAAIAARGAGVKRVVIVDKAAIAMSSHSRLCASPEFSPGSRIPELWYRGAPVQLP